MSRINFTKKTVEALPATKGDRVTIYRDSVARGLGLKIEPSGHRVFFWSRKARGKLEWKTVGEVESITLEDARGKASEFNTALAKWKKDDFPGDDPFARPAALTLGEVIDAYTARHVRHNAAKPDRAEKDIKFQTDRYLSSLRNRKVMTIRRGEILKLREAVHTKHGVYAANRLVQMLRAAMNWSIDQAELWKGPNPAKGIKLYDEEKRDRFLQKHEMEALRKALEDKKTTLDLRDYVRLNLMIGPRKGDLTSMAWGDIAFDRGVWRVPHPKNNEPYYALLTVAAVEILRERKARAERLRAKTGVESPWVFPSHGKSGHLMDLKKSWAKLLERAGIKNLRQHDLRRSFAAWQAAGGASMLIISKGLGQKSTSATPTYARLADEPVRASIEAATRAMFAEPPEPKLLPVAPERKKVRRA